jgi:hypothetical protein
MREIASGKFVLKKANKSGSVLMESKLAKGMKRVTVNDLSYDILVTSKK